MGNIKLILISLIVSFLSIPVLAQDGEYNYISPNNVTETCRVLAKIPGGDYSKSDLEREEELCSADFYNSTFVLCPKTWSTSPATMVRDLSASEFDPLSYIQSDYCGDSRKRKGPGVKNLAKFKTSMNQGSKSLGGGTSGTYSPASLAYYHFSRYFDMKVQVPVAVYRELDRQYHYENIVPNALKNVRRGSMIANGWRWLELVGSDPNSYSPREEFVTEDGLKYYGVLLKGPGERYGVEIQGRRSRGWGRPQHEQMRDEVAPFIALGIEKPLLESVEEAVTRSKSISREMAKALGDVSNFQMVYWMRELSEIILLDSLFGQQDRVGNIDYRWYWNYISIDGKVKDKREKRSEFEELSRERMAESGIILPEESWVADIMPGTTPELIQRTFLNDNDAALRDYSGFSGATIGKYANFPKAARWIDSLRHLSSKTYTKVMELDQDLQSEGPLYYWTLSQLGVNSKSFQHFVNNVSEVAAKLRSQCSQIRFDLDDVDDFILEGVQETQVVCDEL